MYTFFSRLIRRLTLTILVICALIVIAIYAAGKIPIRYVLNMANISIPNNVTLSGTIATGKMLIKNDNLDQPQFLEWQRRYLVNWNITLQGPVSTGTLQAKPRFSGLTLDQVSLKGNSDDFSSMIEPDRETPVRFRYSSNDINTFIDWNRSMVLMRSGTLAITDTSVLENQGWQSVGNFTAQFSANAPRTSANISSSDQNGFIAQGKISIDFSQASQEPSTIDLIVDGYFDNPNKRLLFPWAIPIAGKKNANGYPVSSTITIPL